MGNSPASAKTELAWILVGGMAAVCFGFFLLATSGAAESGEQGSLSQIVSMVLLVGGGVLTFVGLVACGVIVGNRVTGEMRSGGPAVDAPTTAAPVAPGRTWSPETVEKAVEKTTEKRPVVRRPPIKTSIVDTSIFDQPSQTRGRAEFEAFADTFLALDGVTRSNSFGGSALEVNGKVIAFVGSLGELTVAVSEDRAEQLIAMGEAEEVQTGGQVRPGWVSLPVPNDDEVPDWQPLLTEATDFALDND